VACAEAGGAVSSATTAHTALTPRSRRPHVASSGEARLDRHRCILPVETIARRVGEKRYPQGPRSTAAEGYRRKSATTEEPAMTTDLPDDNTHDLVPDGISGDQPPEDVTEDVPTENREPDVIQTPGGIVPGPR
jgi:hypothetical protein